MFHPRKPLFAVLAILVHCQLSVVHCFAQKEANNWYFGKNAGLTFNTDPPSALTDGQLSTAEGCSTISDKNGKLLFYTDGITVWNRKHQVMPNGRGLKGHPSAAQSGVVIPRPGSTTRYIIITVPISSINGDGDHPMCYSEVDMELGGGLGDVLPGNKNTELLPGSSERLAVVRHANGLWYWVVGRNQGESYGRPGAGNGRSYYAYLVDCNGVNPRPVVSESVSTMDSQWDGGYLVFSPDGKRIASSSRSAGVEIANFYISTGKVSGNQKVSTVKGGNWYGVAFSPDGKRLYATRLTGHDLYQWDMTARNIPATQTKIGDTRGVDVGKVKYKGGALQLGPDGKIYMVEHGLSSLGVIHRPNALGKSCNYTPSAIRLGEKIGRMGLPPFVSSFFSEPKRIAISGETMPGASLRLSLEGAAVYDRMEWDFGDGTTSSEVSPTHAYAKNGTYTVRVTVYGSNCSLTEIFTAQIIIGSANRLIVSPDWTICAGESTEIKVSGGDGLDYRWSHNLGTAAKHTVKPDGTTTYTVRTKVRTGTNLVMNGDFEQANTGFESEYVDRTSVNGAGGFGQGRYMVWKHSGPKPPMGWLADCAGHTDGHDHVLLVDASNGQNGVAAGASFWTQTVDVDPNTDYGFFAFGANFNKNLLGSYPENAQIALFVNGVQVGGMASLGAPLCRWHELFRVWHSGNSTTATLSLRELSGLSSSGCDFAIDDISFYKVKEVSASVKVTVNPKKTPEFAPIPALCQGSPAPELSKTSRNSISGTWNPSVVDVSTPGTKSYIFTPNAGECAAQETVKIYVHPKPNVTLAASKTTICAGESITLTAGGAKTYTWNDGMGEGAAKTVSPTATTTYNVTGTNEIGCQNTASITITVNPKITPEFAFLPTGICKESIAPMLPARSANGIPGTWSPATVDVSTPGTKSYTFTPNAGECAVPTTVEFTVNTKPTVTLTASNGNATICEGNTVTLTASGAQTYVWDNDLGEGQIKTVSPPAGTTTYTVFGKDANGCLNWASVGINVHPKLNTTVTASKTSICTGESVVLKANGGTAFTWNHGLGVGQTKTVRPTKTTTYKVRGIDVKYCAGEASITITVNPRPEVTLCMDKTTICPGDVVTLTASGADTYIWTGEGTSGNGPVQKVSPKKDAVYEVVGKLANGCENHGVML